MFAIFDMNFGFDFKYVFPNELSEKRSPLAIAFGTAYNNKWDIVEVYVLQHTGIIDAINKNQSKAFQNL